MTDGTAPHVVESSRLRLVLMGEPFLVAMLEGRREEGAALLGAALPDGWPDDGDRWLLDLRLGQLRKDLTAGPWLVRAMVRREDAAMIGHIGFHGPPEDGVVEIGYTVMPEARRRGYAEEAVRALFDWAAKDMDVRRFRASIGPWNEPSLAMSRKLGFVKVGVQWDERDGEEIVFELDHADIRRA